MVVDKQFAEEAKEGSDEGPFYFASRAIESRGGGSSRGPRGQDHGHAGLQRRRRGGFPAGQPQPPPQQQQQQQASPAEQKFQPPPAQPPPPPPSAGAQQPPQQPPQQQPPPPAPPAPRPDQQDASFLPLVHDIIKCMDKDSQDVHQVLSDLRTKFVEMRKLIKSMQGIGVSPEHQQEQLQNLREQVRTKSELLQKYKSLCMFEIPKE
ncbi:PREDICTED: mediator of RNA polymerase II transcription subunit 9 [Gekko japonicus]|uniref:Mediator of RNA polymerase II transcription subunit 9 n=1 Tax=Gekko japonicus TaxID=146911 RepID=A0ABM1LAY4_GEKJA|nr:PREDICTED: mediator of RNA polymerase II transcription subunit 9 [Gekko japonicus]